jgi:hypothetical protein
MFLTCARVARLVSLAVVLAVSARLPETPRLLLMAR